MPKVKMLTASAGAEGTFPIGQEITVGEKEANELVEGGYAQYVDVPKTESENPVIETDQLKHVGGGWFELPNGEKVKGKEEALEALKELQGSDQ